MKFCYVDESGANRQEPCLIMVGILVDAVRLNRTQKEFADKFDAVQHLRARNLRELKGAKILYGRDGWGKTPLDKRKQIIKDFCEWISEKKHKLALAAVVWSEMEKFAEPNSSTERRDPWLASGLHIALQIQRFNQRTLKNKGHTVLIFDSGRAGKISNLLWDPPQWTDPYYDRGRKQDRLDQIINTSFSIESHYAGLVQVADLFAFIMRRYVEIKDFKEKEGCQDEEKFLGECVSILSELLLRRPHRWPARPGNDAANWFNALAPDSLKALG